MISAGRATTREYTTTRAVSLGLATRTPCRLSEILDRDIDGGSLWGPRPEAGPASCLRVRATGSVTPSGFAVPPRQALSRRGRSSGGQRQRVAVARALANDPLVVLADEPTGNLDTAATLDVLRIFEDLSSAGQTLVIVTHDERVAAMADRLVSMRDGMLVDDTWLAGSRTRGLGGLIGLGE
ncbi:ATP-binding cassette domain-containing protein [Sinosporangium album]|uniref:ATP-binding cassette domain-containing protein n=1 Tax=Sinosporangium album TaxID=504805 RepID=UPI001FDF62E9|nr:ATP-binding cassette domain-containing protein [Sinosporangium album]